MKNPGNKKKGYVTEPRLVTSSGKKRTPVMTAAQHHSLQADIMSTLPLPYQPEFGSPDRIQWPVDRLQQNRYWRLYYKVDPIISTVVDLFADIIASDFTLVGEGVDGEVKDFYEYMVEETQVTSLFPYFIKEFLTLGEVIPHCVFNKDKQMWDSIMFHNPDQINVVDSPFVNIDPLIEFTPDESLKALISNSNPAIQEVISKLPPTLLQAIQSGGNIPLDTKLNATFLARKVHPYDIRGTSIMTRLYRVLMYEDAVVNASIATARRHAGPLKIAKLGDAAMNWVPDEEFEGKIIELLAAAEMDPHAFLVLPWFVQFEAFGTTERMMSISREWDVIERIKLTALGVSQGFLHGEATYASMKGNMQTLLMRLRSLRLFFEDSWWYPKYFRPIAEMNEFIKPSQAEVTHRLRIKRSRRELIEQNKYIIPKMQWSRALDPRVDQELLEAFEQIVTRLNLPISSSTIYAAAGLDVEEELQNMVQDAKAEREIEKENNINFSTEDGNSLGGGNISFEGSEGENSEGEVPEGEALLEEELEEEVLEEEVSPEEASSQRPRNHERFSKQDVGDLMDLITTGETDSDFWSGAIKEGSSLENFGDDFEWETVEHFLEDESYSNHAIDSLKRSLIKAEILQPEPNEKLIAQIDDKLSDKLLDKDFEKESMNILNQLPKKKVAKKEDDIPADTFFAGKGNKVKSRKSVPKVPKKGGKKDGV